jgi:hypothetical protein
MAQFLPVKVRTWMTTWTTYCPCSETQACAGQAGKIIPGAGVEQLFLWYYVFMAHFYDC